MTRPTLDEMYYDAMKAGLTRNPPSAQSCPGEVALNLLPLPHSHWEQIADQERGTIDANTGRPAPDAIGLSRFLLVVIPSASSKARGA